MTHPECLLCGQGLNNTSHKLQFLRLAFIDDQPEPKQHRRYMIRVVVNCYTNMRHYKKWVPLDTLIAQIQAGEVGGRNVDLEPEHDMWDVLLHLGGKPLIRWEDSQVGANDAVEATL